MSTTTNTYSFVIYVKGVDVLSDASMDALQAAGCDDATLGAREGARYAAFDREAPNFDEAVASAVQNLTSALPGIEVVRVESERLAHRRRAG
jgi:hypothetical protein